MNRFTFNKYPLFCGLLVTLAIMLVIVWIGALKSEQQQQQQRTNILSHLSNTRGRLEAVLNARLHLVQGLVALVETGQSISESEFQSFARSLHHDQAGIRSLQLAPDAVVRYVYPLEGNASIIGHDLLADPNRFPSVQRAIFENKFFITGPVDLIQGGVALIGRRPIFVEDPLIGEEFWGFATILLDVEPLLREGGVLEPPPWIEYALRGRDGLGSKGAVFYGRPEIFQQNAVELAVTLPEGSWQLAAIPTAGWQSNGSNLIFFFGVLLAVVCGTLSSLSLSRKQQLQNANDSLEQRVLKRTAALKKSNQELKQAAEEKTTLQVRLQNTIDSMPSAMLSIDGNGIINQWNLSAARTTGIESAAALGCALTAILPQLAAILTDLDVAEQEGTPVQKGPLQLTLRETARYYEITIFPLKDTLPGGTVIRLDDVSERIHMQELIIHSEKMLSVGGLAAGMAHEINNPLAGILQSLQIINMRLSPQVAKNQQLASRCGIDLERLQDYLEQRNIAKMLQGAQESGQRAAKIVDNMLNFSRKGNFTPEPQPLKRLIEGTLDLIRKDYNPKSRYDFRKIPIAQDFDPALEMVSCDASQIQQVLLNLLKNSVQAMTAWAEMQEPPRIVIRTRAEEGMARIELEDNGPGMDEEVRKRIFEPFYTTKEAGVGTGLGLSICYFIITQNHNGSMEVESNPGQGAKFLIRLPLADICLSRGENI